MLGTDHASVLLQDKCIFPWRVLVQYRAEFPVQFPYHFVLQEYNYDGSCNCPAVFLYQVHMDIT